MILVLSLVGSGLVLGLAAWQMVRHGRRSPPPDPHWGDVPPDQMAP